MNCECGCGQVTPVWRKNEFTRGRFKGEHTRFVPGHFDRPSIPFEDRFWAKVAGGDVNDCWEWQGYVMPNGYGQANDTKTMLAHRWAYEHIRGDIPKGLDLDHLCRNRKCVNPWHLEPVTRAVNLARGRGNKKRTNVNQRTST